MSKAAERRNIGTTPTTNRRRINDERRRGWLQLNDLRIALFFMIPGLGETLRINGGAAITVDPELMDRFVVKGKAAEEINRSVHQIATAVESVAEETANGAKTARDLSSLGDRLGSLVGQFRI
ncbi:hypothetical protein [Halopseudomonas pelagia]|uniref:Methyl-accepting chemotaxis protein n=1 Tax=Halopseudomonas pelagia TaxID=553151 RepID=A0AA91U0Q6_9GAMM|nr:hypothetical protein [Halopseudomonas pelagia]PCC98338.1 hypothetical protein CO192_16260 [Halopseudomonas pelagia]QFY56649.1 hypothetical protein EAO82_09865 [Halopseudomonas pelagia]